MKIVVAGGSGFLGSALVKRLSDDNHNVVLLTRRPETLTFQAGGSVVVQRWDGKASGPWVQQLEGADGVVNLVGESIGAKRWTSARRALIVGSRVEATKAIVSAIGELKKRPSVLINASAVGYYGNVETGDVTESHPRGNDFLATLSEQWESEAQKAETFGVRVVRLRFGVVLEKDGGALEKMMVPFKLFVGGHLGSGRQWFPWVHRDDVIGAILFTVQNPTLSGPVNVVAPEPVTMKEFCKALGKAMGRPSWVPVPAFVLHTLLGEMSEMLLTGQKVVATKLEATGYRFHYARLDEALSAILKN